MSYFTSEESARYPFAESWVAKLHKKLNQENGGHKALADAKAIIKDYDHKTINFIIAHDNVPEGIKTTFRIISAFHRAENGMGKNPDFVAPVNILINEMTPLTSLQNRLQRENAILAEKILDYVTNQQHFTKYEEQFLKAQALHKIGDKLLSQANLAENAGIGSTEYLKERRFKASEKYGTAIKIFEAIERNVPDCLFRTSFNLRAMYPRGISPKLTRSLRMNPPRNDAA